MKREFCFYPRQFLREDIMAKKDEVEQFLRNLDITLAFFFGSVSREGASLGDIDIAVVPRRFDLSPYELYEKVYSGLCEIFSCDNIDVLLLDNCNTVIKMRVLEEGIPIYGEKEESLTEFVQRTITEYLEEEGFRRESALLRRKRIEEGLSVAERKVDAQRMESHLSMLDEAVRRLRTLTGRFCSSDEFYSQIENRELCVHFLRIALESVLDICRHFIASTGVDLSKINSTNIIELAGSEGMIPYEFAQRIRGMAGMRNAIVHVYWNLDYQAVYRMITERIGDLDEFARYVLQYLEQSEIGK